MKKLQLAAQLILCSLFSSAAFAVDGVLEINQACAINGGCFKDDTAGFPVTISESGSYRLTSNLATARKEVTAIMITTSDVTVDLNGFTIACAFGAIITMECAAPTGSGHGVAVDDIVTRFRVTVRNGVVRGMGDDGIHLGNQSRVEKVHVANNGDEGISVNSNSIVTASTARNNLGVGIFTNNGTIVTGSTAQDNGSHGIEIGRGSSVRGSTALNNTGHGISTDHGAIVTESTARDNNDRGISTISSSVVSRNIALSNDGIGILVGSSSMVTGNTANGNGGDGILASNECLVIGNVTQGNTGFGLSLFSELSGFRENVIGSNTAGTVSNGTNLGNNLCEGGACP